MVPVVVRESEDSLGVLFEDSVIKLLLGDVFFGRDPIIEYSIMVFPQVPCGLEQF
jgi:hypothetical protein